MNDCLASLGSGGAWPSNIERDLHRWLRNLYDVRLEPSFLKLDLLLPHVHGPQPVQMPVLPLHVVMHCIANAGPMQFAQSLVGPAGQARCAGPRPRANP